MTERLEILERMKKIEGYFQRHASENKAFNPEFECARAIRERVVQGNHLTIQDVHDILKICNETNAGPHYNGSGWLDYQLHLRHLLTVDGFIVDVDNNSGQMRIGGTSKV
jgi:hypothetical protein